MERDDIIRMADENGIVIVGEAMFRFAALVAAHEREACARVCEGTTASWSQSDYNSGCVDCAKAICARGEEPKRHPGYIIGDHWLQAAYTRICTGETEDEVMTDYGWQRARGEK